MFLWTIPVLPGQGMHFCGEYQCCHPIACGPWQMWMHCLHNVHSGQMAENTKNTAVQKGPNGRKVVTSLPSSRPKRRRVGERGGEGRALGC